MSKAKDIARALQHPFRNSNSGVPTMKSAEMSQEQKDLIKEMEALYDKAPQDSLFVLGQLISATKSRVLTQGQLAVMRTGLEQARESIDKKESEKPVKHHVGIVGGLVLMKARSTVRNCIKEKRLVFQGDDKLVYTNQQGKETVMDFNGFVQVLVDAGGILNFAQVGVTPDDFKAILIEEYQKQMSNKTGGRENEK